jgi:Holliday junction DNA helicase RuvA
VIGSLRGTVLERIPPSTVLVEVSGVGYLCQVTPATLAELEPTSPVFLHVHHHVREDAMTLFGFLSRSERDTFQLLISTHGIGPSLGLAILSVHAPTALADVIATGDAAALTTVPGVGKKTAERLLVELRDTMADAMAEAIAAGSPEEHSASSVASVREALANLGYTAEEIRVALQSLPVDSTAESMLRHALSALGARRA